MKKLFISFVVVASFSVTSCNENKNNYLVGTTLDGGQTIKVQAEKSDLSAYSVGDTCAAESVSDAHTWRTNERWVILREKLEKDTLYRVRFKVTKKIPAN